MNKTYACFFIIKILTMKKALRYNAELLIFYTKHHLKFRKNQADNLEYMRFRRRFFLYFFGV